jgi:hypothetical protein
MTTTANNPAPTTIQGTPIAKGMLVQSKSGTVYELDRDTPFFLERKKAWVLSGYGMRNGRRFGPWRTLRMDALTLAGTV